MKYTNFNIIGIINILGNFNDKKLPQRISYAITRNLMIFQKEYSCYETQLKKIFEKYDKDILRDDEGKQITDKNGIPSVNNDAKEGYYSEISDLLNIEVDVPVFHIDESVFDYSDDNCRYDPMSATDIITLQSVLCNQS